MFLKIGLKLLPERFGEQYFVLVRFQNGDVIRFAAQPCVVVQSQVENVVGVP